MKLSLFRLKPGSSMEDRRDFAETFNACLDQLKIKPGDAFEIHSVEGGEHAPMPGHCSFCKEPVDVHDQYRTWKRDSGYTVKRYDGGTNRIAIKREHFDDLACDRCIRRLKRGISPTQETLIA
jgi:hypothetical protein